MSNINKYLIGAIIVLVLALGFTWAQNSNLQKTNKKWVHNYETLRDSMELVTTKNGEILFENNSLIIQKNELENALNISKKQVKDYEKTLGSKLAYISKLEAKLEIKDTVVVEKEKIIHDTLTNSYLMSYCDDWFKFDERFSLENPKEPRFDIYNINMNVPLKVGLTDDYTIFVTSPNPYFSATDIEGAVIDGSRFAPKKSHWTFGFYAGWGLGYGIINKQLDTGPQAGVGIGFRF